MKLLVVIPFCQKDKPAAIRLVQWIAELGGCPENDCMFVAANDVTDTALPSGMFKSRHLISPPSALPDESHPIGPNRLFETTLLHLIRQGGTTPFLWLEPDCVPLHTGWLAEIEAEYDTALKQKRTILAHIARLNDPRFPEAIPSGVAVYPATAWKYYSRLQLNRKVAWDIQFAREAMRVTHPATTIYSLVVHQNAPTFAGGNKNTLRLNQIPKAAALFHPNKDGTLIGLLRARTKVVHTPPAPPALVAHDPLEPSGPYDCRGPETWKLADFMATAPLILTPKNLPPVSARPNRIIHVVQRWKPNDVQVDRRIHVAVRSWIRLYMTGEVAPCHVWPPYERDARGLGDARNLPYLRDILNVGLKAASKADDIVMLTNDDNVLHPDLASVLFERLAKQPCLCAGRVNYKEKESPTFMPESKMATASNDIGRDLFAFRADWLKKNFQKIPDMLMGEAQFDIVLASWIRQTNSVPVSLESRTVAVPECELPFGWVQHEDHVRGWMCGPTNGQKHNITTAAKWYKANKLSHMVDFDYLK